MPRAGLTPERIIGQAAAVADEVGLDRLTLAAVAQRCGVSLPGLLIKGGAEGVDGFALSDGRAGAVKIDDGAHRGRTPVSVAALRLLGAAVPAELATAPVIGGEAEVGVIRAAGGLARQS